jgi:hypothetical protein
VAAIISFVSVQRCYYHNETDARRSQNQDWTDKVDAKQSHCRKILWAPLACAFNGLLTVLMEVQLGKDGQLHLWSPFQGDSVMME